MTRKCAVCRVEFEPRQSFQTWCGIDHGVIIAAKRLAKAKTLKAANERKADKEMLDNLKSKSRLAREVQTAFNAWVRARDHGNACISCGRHQGQKQAGHYLSVGARPELRFEPLNVWVQCAQCNNNLSGNLVLYRKALLGKIGQEKLDWLEGPHEQKHYTRGELIAIKAEYTAKTKQLKAKS